MSHAPLKHTICRSFFAFTVLWVLCCTLSALTNVYLWWYPESLGAVELDLGALLHTVDQHAMSVLVDFADWPLRLLVRRSSPSMCCCLETVMSPCRPPVMLGPRTAVLQRHALP